MSARGLLIPTPAGRSYDQWSRDVYRYLNDLTTRENDPQSVQLAFQTGGEKRLAQSGRNNHRCISRHCLQNPVRHTRNGWWHLA